MNAQNTRHPHWYTLQLMKFSLDHLPPTFPEKKRKKYQERLDRFMDDPNISYDAIHHTIVDLGKESWPERMAYREMYLRYGRSSEEANLLNNLDEGIRGKYERFIHEGGKIDHVEHANTGEQIWEKSPFESYFTPEEKFAIEQALLAARDAAREEIDQLVIDAKKEEYQESASSYKERMAEIQKRIDELRRLADVSDKWKGDILDRVKHFEEGWSVIERGIDEIRLQKDLEHWNGTLEAFLSA